MADQTPGGEWKWRVIVEKNGQLEEVLVITNMGEQLPPKEKLDLIKSQAAASAEQLRASEVLAERLPSRIDPDAPKSDDDSADNGDASADGGVARPLRPPSALHPDRFSPNTTPSSSELLASRFAPCKPLQPASPTAYKPGRLVLP